MDARYPVGRFTFDAPTTPERRASWCAEIAEAPRRLRAAVAGLDDGQLDTSYREGGWTVRQVAHHLADSHVNAYVRYRLGLTADGPRITPYDEARWAELADARSAPVDTSVRLIEALHERWVTLIRATDPEDFARHLVHPEHADGLSLDKLVALYAWHGRHHVGQIEHLRDRRGWR